MPLPESKKTGGAASTKVKSSSSSDVAPPPGKPVETLPCPRCDSMNTKFCYYNNYSVSQPRHFCRQCQRYWTAGGTLRNVPVGGGSRKKNRAGGYPRIDPYTLHHRSGSIAQVAGYPQPGSMGTTSFQHPGFPHQMVTPDMAASFGSHPNGLHHYVPHRGVAYTTPGMMYGTGPPLALQMGSAAGGLTFELNNLPAGGENHPPQESQENVTTSQGLLEQSTTSRSVNNNITVPGTTTAASTLSTLQVAEGNGADVHEASLNRIPGQKTSTSPPHGSSTIEEEGSTPTNGYSNNGYEEGDVVSSMWHEMHDMDNVLFQ